MNPFALRAAVAISLVAPVAFAAQFKFPTQTFTVPDGFEVELVAGPPLVERPVSASFDDQGRLYVTDSSGSNEKPDKQLANPPHRVVRLEDTNGDGRFDKSVVFADKVMFPQGCLWHDGSVYVAGPPSIWNACYGVVFGKQNDVLEDGRVKRTGPDLLHPFYEAGNAAECGLCRYESAIFGADYRDNFFATTFNLHKVTRHVLRPNGATYASTDSDFVVSDSTDFHPTDVLEDADGSLLVVDTGGWYKLCCPSSQLAKPDVLGAIYRVRKHGAQKLPDSAKRSAYARVIKPSLDLTKFWVVLKQAAMQRDSKPASVMHELLQEKIAAAATSNESARMARIAAEGLGRLGYRPAVPVLLHATGLTEDAIIEHSLTFALIEIADPALTRAGLKKTPSTWITALWPVVDTDNAVLVKEAVLTARALTLSKTNAMELIGTLSRVAHNAGWPPDVRLDALTALPAGLSSVEPDIFDFLRANLDAKKPPMLRAAAAEIIYRAKLNEEQLIELTDTLKIAGPLELSTLLGAFAHATSEAVGLRLVAALNESKGLAGLRVDLLKPLLEKFPATVQEQGQALLAKLNVDLEKQKAH